MIYLLAQMLLALIVAAIFGGAIGWLIHRASFARQTDQLRNALSRQHQQLSQMQSEVSMLTDDYDELQRRSQDEITALRDENQQIPILNTNLEKSQLLVRQMLQRHEAKIRDLNHENQKLLERLKKAEARELAHNMAEAERDSVRRLEGVAGSSADTSIDTGHADSKLPDEPHSQATEDGASEALTLAGHAGDDGAAMDRENQPASSTQAGSDTDSTRRAAPVVATAGTTISNTRNSRSWASAPLAVIDSVGQGTEEDELMEASSEPMEAAEDDLDVVHVVEAEDIRDIADFDADSIADTADMSPFAGEAGAIELNADDSFSEVDADVGRQEPAEVTATGDMTDSADATDVSDSSDSSDSSDATEADPFDQVIEVNDEMQRELDIDGDEDTDQEDDLSDDDTSLFDPVEQQDDLQQIFGIGPVTEKALNELGITSYSQLAKLRHHEIEAIANALHIVPGRIERDDWVGNARKQLEDVLEEL